MKVFVRMNNTTPTGYELVSINDDGQEIVQEIVQTYPNEPHTLVLPENASNRKYFNSKKVDKNGGEIELTYKESKSFGPRTITTGPETTITKSDREYLNDDDKALYDQLMAKIEKAKAIAKAKAIYEAAQREYEELLKAGENND